MRQLDLMSYIRNVPDFPKAGVQFKDVTTLLKEKDAFRKTIDILTHLFEDKNIDLVVGIEARGFIFGAPVAYLLNCGFVPIRKQGKLPAAVKSKTYALEYGTASLEMHTDAIMTNQRVAIIDDLLATGGTTRAACDMIEELGGEIVGIGYVIELESFQGRKLLEKYPVYSLMKIE